MMQALKLNISKWDAGPAKAVVHFIGGAFVGAAPQLSYRLLLESLAARGLYVSPRVSFHIIS